MTADLFDSNDRNLVIQFLFRASFLQVIINFSRTEKQSFDTVGILRCRAFLRNYSEELRILQHQVEVRLGFRMTEQRLWCHKNQWFSEWQCNLTPQDVKVISRCAAVGDNPIAVMQLTNSKLFTFRGKIIRIIGRHLKETL